MDEQNVPVRPDSTSVIQPQTSGTFQDVGQPAADSTPTSFTQTTVQNDAIPSPYESLDGDENTETLGTTSVSESTASNSTQTILAQQAPAPKKSGFGVRDRDLNKVLTRVVAGGVVVMFLLFGGVSLANRLSSNRPVDPIAGVAEQELSSLSGGDAETLGIETSNSTLLVNGNILTVGELQVSDGTVTSTIALTQGASSQTYTLPDSSGVFCLDSNNCGYLQAGDVPNTTIAGNDGDFSIGTGLALNGSTISNTMTQTSVNNSIGAITLQGTTNRVSITKNGNTFTLSGPQDLGLTDTPTFDSITLTNVGTQNGNVLCDISNNCGYAGGANAFIQNGNAFGAEAVLGTNDSYNLSFETDGVIRATIDTSGNLGITGQFVSGNSGTASNPGFTFVSDQDTGLYRSNANEVAISTGGVNNTTFSTSGVDIAGHLAVGDGASVSSPTALLIDETYTSADAFNCVFGCYGAQIVVRAESGGPGSGIANIALQAAIGDGVTQGNATGIFINSAALGAGATLQNAYGIRIANQTGSVSGYGIEISGATTQALWVGSGGTYTTANQGIAFGSGRDVNLYRSAADVLRTDDSLFVAGNASRFQSSTDSTTALQVLDADGGNPVLSIDTTNERVGIGTASPTTELDVTGDVNISNRLQVGPTGDTVGQCATIFGPLSCDVALDVANASSETSIASYGIHTATTINPAGANSASNVGAYSQLTLSGTNNYIATNSAVYGLASSSSTSGTISRLIGVQGSAGIFTTSSTANISEAMGLYGAVGVISTVSGGTIENGYGLYIDVASASDTGAAVTTNYGIYVSPQTNTSTNGTANYGIAVGAADTQTLWLSSNADNTSASAGIAFGLSRDTNLYRSAANTLRTDDALSVGDDITVTGDILPSADDTYDLGSNSNRWRDLYLGPATLSIGTSATDYKISYDTGNNALLFNNGQDDRDFRIAGDTQANLLYVDAGNNRIGIGTSTPGYELDVVGTINASTGINVNGTQVCTASGCIAAPGSGNYIQNGTSIQTNTNFAIQSAAAGSVGAVIRGASGQTANLQEWQSSTGTVLAYISSEGYLNSPRFKEDANGVVIGGALTPQAGTNVLVESTGGSNKALVVKGASGQTANLQEWQNSSGAILSNVDASGRASFGSNSTSWGMQAIASGTAITGYTYGGVGVMGQSLTNAGVAMVARGCGACAGNLQEWQDSTGSVLTQVGSTGAITLKNTAVDQRLVFASSGTSAGNILWGSGSTTGYTLGKDISGYFRLANSSLVSTRNLSFNGADGLFGINTQYPTTAALEINVPSAANLGLIVRGASSQSANLQSWRNSSDTQLVTISATGELTLTQATNFGNTSRLRTGGSGFLDWDTTAQTVKLGDHSSTWNSIYIGHGGSATRAGNVLVGANTGTPGARLHVKGSDLYPSTKGLIVQGAVSQSANLQEWQNSSSTALASVNASGQLTATGLVSTQTGTANDLYFNRSDTNAVRIKSNWGGSTAYGVQIQPSAGSVTSYASGYGVLIGNAYSSPVTSGNYDILRVYDNAFNPSSGSSQLNGININPIINQTGTASGISRGVYINPTLTSAVDFRGIEIANASGYGLYQSGASVINYLNGVTKIGSNGTAGTVEKFRVNTPTTVDNLAATILSTGATTSKGLVVQGAASQTANLQEWQDSSGTILTRVNADGSIALGGVNTASTGALRLANNTYIYARNAANTDNKQLLGYDSADNVVLGGSGTSVNVYIMNAIGSGIGVSTTAISSGPGKGIYQTGSALGLYHYNGNITLTPGASSSFASVLTAARSGTNITVQTAATTDIGLVVKGTASQTANLQEWQDSTGSVLASVGTTGNISITNADNPGTRIMLNQTNPNYQAYLQTNYTGNSQGYRIGQSNSTGPEFFVQSTQSNNYFIRGGYNNMAVVIGPSADQRAAISDYGSNSAATLIVQDSRASVGATRLVVRAGAGQSTTNLQEWQNSAGTVLTSISANGILNVSSSASGTEHDLGVNQGVRIGTFARFGSGSGGASAGAIRLFNNTFVNWRNAANSADIGIRVDTNNTLQLGAAATTLDTVADTTIGTSGTTRKGLVIQGVASQTASLQEWQSSTGTVLASIAADGDLEVVDATVNGNLVVDGTATFNGNITVNGHVITGNTSGSTTVTVNTTGAGTGASASISGNDTAGVITINTGTGAAAGTLATVTFANAFGSAPEVIITPKSIPGGGTFPQYHFDSATTTFDLKAFNALTDSSTYTFTYMIVE